MTVYTNRIGHPRKCRPHAEVPLVALPGLAHLGVPLTAAVLGGTGRGNQCGVHHSYGLEHQTSGGKGCITSGQQLDAQVVLFRQIAKCRAAPLLWPDQTDPLRTMVSTGTDGCPPLGRCPIGRKRLNQAYQLRPWHNKIYLIEKHPFAHALGYETEPSSCKSALFHKPSVAQSATNGMGFADLL
jgi:hypothetical protein